MNKKTKIIATIGPASESADMMKKLLLEGVDLFRFNLKHNDFEWHKKNIDKAKKIAKELKLNLGIILDFQGPEMRIETEYGAPIEVFENEVVYLADKFIKNKKTLVLNPKEVLEQIEIGDKIFINDGDLEALVVEKDDNIIGIKTNRDYVVGNHKSLNIPDKLLRVPLLCKRDLEFLSKINLLNADFAALSFVRTAKDVEEFRKLIKKYKGDLKIIAKIENSKAIEGLEDIVLVSDAVMIARGDLGVEVPLMELAYWQKKIIDVSRKSSKPVIVATQLLQSMVNNFNPSRAEATDVANAIFDGIDAMLLSEETAIGKHPVRVIEEMKKIITFCEKNGETKKIDIKLDNLTELLVDAAVKITNNATNFPIKAIVVFTESGNSARVLSRYRLDIPIVAVTNNEKTFKELSLSYGIYPYLNKFKKSSFKADDPLFKDLISFEFINKLDTLLTIHGNNWMESGSNTDISLIKI
jgi:pyruvate kinase